MQSFGDGLTLSSLKDVLRQNIILCALCTAMFRGSIYYSGAGAGVCALAIYSKCDKSRKWQLS